MKGMTKRMIWPWAAFMLFVPSSSNASGDIEARLADLEKGVEMLERHSFRKTATGDVVMNAGRVEVRIKTNADVIVRTPGAITFRAGKLVTVQAPSFKTVNK